MLWDNLIEAGKKANEEYHRAMKEQAELHRDAILGMFRVFFTKHPYVDAVAWSQTEEDYDDNTYGGYEWISMRARYFPDKIDEEMVDYVEQYSNYHQNFVEVDRWGYNAKTAPALAQAVQADLDALEAALRGHGTALAHALFGDSGCVADRNGIRFYGPDEDIK